MQLSFVIFGVIENGFAEALAAEVLDKLFDGDMEAAKRNMGCINGPMCRQQCHWP